MSVALIIVEPGAMREMHFHLTIDEWNYFLQESGRLTVYVAPQSSGAFDYTAGDVGVAQWLALTPSQAVMDTLGLPQSTVNNLPEDKTYFKSGNRNLTAIAGASNGTTAYQPAP